MIPLSLLPDTEAISLWNNFTSNLPAPAPFSFNPSLFYFYRKHFHWDPYYLLLFNGEKLTGLLPLVNTGKTWVSLPHFSYGGWLESKNNSNKVNTITGILQELKKRNVRPGFYKVNLQYFSKQNNTLYERLFIRSLGYRSDKNCEKSEKVTYLIQLQNKEKTFASLSSNLRRKIRKASKCGLQFKVGNIELLNDFYKVYSANIYFLKSLNYGKSFFNNLFSCWNYGDIKFVIAYYDKKPVGSALLASYNGFYENLFFATANQMRRYYISDRLHWQMILYALESNKSEYSVYSFGRSTVNSSVHTYKMHWPVSVVPLFKYTSFNEIKKTGLLREIWGLLPYFIAHPLGSRLIKHIY